MWQVTCECGYRLKGTRDEIVTGMQEHGRSAHGRELSMQDVLDIAVQLPE